MEKEIVTGNYFDKYNSKNPVYKRLMARFFKDLTELAARSFDNKNNRYRVLEAGCGEGHLASILLEKFNELKYTGFDIDEELTQQAQKLIPEANFRQGNIYDLSDYRDNNFDLCIVSEVMEHVDEPEKAIEELKQQNSEYFLFSVPREPVWRMLNMMRLKYIKNFGNTPGHLQHWNKKQFTNLIEKYFSVIEIRSPFPWTMVLCKKAGQ